VSFQGGLPDTAARKEKHPERKRGPPNETTNFLGDHKADEISNMENKQIEKNVVPLARDG